MPSLRTGVPRRARRLTALVLSLASTASTSCDSLFGGFTADNQDNCVVNATLCPAPDQTCNPNTKLCEPATILTAVDPPSGSNVGGTAVKISGDRFIAGMTVLFDGVPATAVMVSGAQQLTAMTPPRPGRQGPVTVELSDPTGKRVQMDKLFRYYGEVTFQKQCFQGPSGATTVIAADLNGDGKPDLLVPGSSMVRPYLNGGDGLTFQAMADVKPGFSPQNVAAADLNGDGKLDLMIPAAVATNSIMTALGNGDGTFAALVQTPTAQPPYGAAVADVNGDKRLDVVTLQNLDLVVQLGRGDGTFLAEQHTPYMEQNSRSGSTTVLADLDGDGVIDALPMNPITQTFVALFGQAAGGWTAPVVSPLSAVSFNTLVSDYNQDGVLDVAIGFNRSAAKVDILQGLGGRRFGALATVMLKSNFRLQTQGDFNGDGLADLVVMDAGGLTDNVIVQLGVGGGRFVALAPLTVPTAAVAGAVGDWNGDRHQDLVTISNTGDSVCILLTTPQ